MECTLLNTLGKSNIVKSENLVCNVQDIKLEFKTQSRLIKLVIK
jgi:hypothetical protein